MDPEGKGPEVFFISEANSQKRGTAAETQRSIKPIKNNELSATGGEKKNGDVQLKKKTKRKTLQKEKISGKKATPVAGGRFIQLLACA